MTAHKIWLHNFEAFLLASYISYHLIILEQYISFWDRYLEFLIFQFDDYAFCFWAPYISLQVAFLFF